MRRLLMILLVAACLLPQSSPVRAQATADQLNKLSLEALTTPAPGGNPGPSYRRRAYQRSFYHAIGRGYHGKAFRRTGSYRAANRSSYHRRLTPALRYAGRRHYTPVRSRLHRRS